MLMSGRQLRAGSRGSDANSRFEIAAQTPFQRSYLYFSRSLRAHNPLRAPARFLVGA